MEKLMLVSDYDGTLKSDIKNLKINIKAINKFRKKGNIFVISTGRSYSSIKDECKRYNITYDYLLCKNGCVLFDKNDNVIYKKCIDDELLLRIDSIIDNYSGIKNIKYYNSYKQTNLTFDNSIIEIKLKLNIINDYEKLQKYLNEKYPNVNISHKFIYASLKTKTDKSEGLKILANILKEEVSKENIITVGDGDNDLTMPKDFNGYKLLSSYPVLYGKGIKSTKEVHTLINKLAKKY